jgi:hypothetical protein
MKLLLGARPVKPWKEPHAHTLYIILVYPHITPDIFDVVLKSRHAQLRTECEWEEEDKEKRDTSGRPTRNYSTVGESKHSLNHELGRVWKKVAVA